MYSETIPMARMRSIFEVDKIFGLNEEIKVVRKTDSLLEFERGNIWSSSSPKKAYLQGTIHFGGDSKTNININFDRSKYNNLLGVFTFLCILLGIITILTGLWFIDSMNRLNFEGISMVIYFDVYNLNKGYSSIWTFPLFILLFSKSPDTWGIWFGIICLIIPIPFFIYTRYYYQKAENIFSKELFLHLINISYTEEP